MKTIKVVGSILAVLVILLFVSFLYIKSSLTPSYQGTVTLDEVANETEIYYTEHGIPHIYASSSEDAYFAFGYAHAQDRLWQMDLLRHVGSGRLSELFGKDLVDTDRYLRTMGVAEYAKTSSLEYLTRNHESLNQVQSYVNGINAYIENNPKPLEHLVLGLEVEPFEIQNIFETLTYMSFSFQNAQMTDPFLTELTAKLDSSYMKDLMIFHYPEEHLLKSYDDRYSRISDKAMSALNNLNVPTFIGSNSWVLSGKKTESGSVILANDPHIGFSQPSIWYEAHLVMPDKEYYGYHISGVPFPLLVHNEKYANGLTMFENDDLDFFIEEIHPEDSNRYRYNDEWVEMLHRKEVINVKDEEPVTMIVRTTEHGPVVSDILSKEPLEEIVSMFWIMQKNPNRTLELLHLFGAANNIVDVEQAASMIHSPGLNLMYGDAQGNIAWWASGKLIKRKDELASKTFFDGSINTHGHDSTYGFEKNPHAINPPWNYVHSANNQPDSAGGVLYSGYYLPDDRSERISQLLEKKEKFSVEDMKKMTMDDQSMMFESIKGIMLHSIKDDNDKKLVASLLEWNGTYEIDDFRPLIFQKWIYEILEATMKDEMDSALWADYQTTHTYKVAIEHLVKNEKSVWWDNVNTTPVETRAEVIRMAFETSISDLRQQWGKDHTTWRWGDAHQLTHNHAMGEVLSFLNVGPFKSSGGNEVINNMGYTFTGVKEQPIIFGPSTRRIIDFADVRNNSWSILPTGQSGSYFSPYYADQAEMFIKGEFRKMKMNHEEIKQSSNKLILTPNK